MKNKLRNAVLATLTASAVAVGIVLTPKAADAATEWDRCLDGWFCVFSDAEGRGVLYHLPSRACYDLRGTNPIFNDHASSWWNRGKTSGTMWNWTGAWSKVDDVAIGERTSLTGLDPRNDVIDRVCAEPL